VSDLYPLGQPVTLTTSVSSGTPAVATDPTALTLTVALAGGVTVVKHWPTPAEIVRDQVGEFHYDLTPSAAGHYVTYWTTTGTAAGVSPYSTVFDVFDPATVPRLVSLTDARTFLPLRATTDADQIALLDRIIGWASARILIEVQAFPAAITEVVAVAAGGCFVLSRCPVVSVTSMTPLSSYWPAVDVTKLVVTSPAGGVVESVGVAPAGTYTVVYQAGYPSVPPGVDGACLQLVQHWWNQSQAHGSATYGDSGFVPDFRELPNSVRSKLGVVPLLPGIA
jgi:hypothetical protein